MIYFAQAGADGLIKIGTSKDPHSRLAELGTSSPHSVTLLGIVPGERAEEIALHARFAVCRVRGEWFSATPELLAYIAEHAKMPGPKVRDVGSRTKLTLKRVRPPAFDGIEGRLHQEFTKGVVDARAAYAAAVSRGVWRAMQRYYDVPYEELRCKAHVEVAHDLLCQLRLQADIAQYEPPPPRLEEVHDVMPRRPSYGSDLVDTFVDGG